MKVRILEKTNKKRKISIFTVILWLFLVTTLITITVNSTKKTNALEVQDENLNISLVMYDRNIEIPNEAITEFTWNAENENETKQLCIQINYTCTTGRSYKPGEIEISIPSLINRDSYSERYYNASKVLEDATISADWVFSTIKQYDFTYNILNGYYIFTNNKEIDKNEHFEGTIQILYNLKPVFKETTELEFKAKIKENIEGLDEIITKESNVCKFHYTSKKSEYALENNVSLAPKSIYQNLEDVIKDYYWVMCSFSTTNTRKAPIKAFDEKNIIIDEGNEKCIKETLPDGCVLYDYNFNKVESRESNSYYYLELEGSEKRCYYIGYPKNKYNVGDSITNTAELWGRYEDEENIQKLTEDRKNIILEDFDFEYTGSLYKITKTGNTNGTCYVSMVKSENGLDTLWKMNATAFYTGNKMDVEIGDDNLSIARKDGNITKLENDEYCFISIIVPVFKTYNKFTGEAGDTLVGYNYEIQVKYKDSDEYVKYNDGITSNRSSKFTFPLRGNTIVGVKLVIKDLDKTLYSGTISANVKISTQNVGKGNLNNYNYLNVYTKDSDENIKLVSKTTARGFESIEEGELVLSCSKSNELLTNNVKKEKYELRYNLRCNLGISNFSVDKDCIIKQYDILPQGMSLTSSKEDIIKSIHDSYLSGDNSYSYRLKLKDGSRFKDGNEFSNYIKENTEVEIDYNYKNSGRTRISITYNLNEIDWSYYANKNTAFGIIAAINIEIPYDSILEYGTKYENYLYAMWNNQEYSSGYPGFWDDGHYDELARDIDNDGEIYEMLTYSYTVLNINHVASSKQSVIEQVRTDLTKGNFVGGVANLTAGSEYTYKLKVTTGANTLKDLIIYDTLETILDENGNDISSGWKGKFLNVDTTYAESKGYAPIVYYSEEINPGKLAEIPEKWKLLTEDTEKTKVKSICVDLRYKADGSEMELSSNNVVFVLINMQASEDETLLASSNNMFKTNWRAKDPMGETIDNIEGIYSNQVNVEIYLEKNKKKTISGTKTWEGDGYRYKYYRPDSITVKLLQDGIECMRKDVTSSDEWKYEFENVPVYKNEGLEEYVYTIEEVEVPGYGATYDGYNITNTLITEDIEVEKIWDDNDNEHGLRPKNILIRVYDGEELIDSMWFGDWWGWKRTFNNLPSFRTDGSKIEYRVDEEITEKMELSYAGEWIEEENFENEGDIELYKERYIKQINGTTITNKYVEPNEIIKITGTKVWEDDNNKAEKRPDSIVLQIKNGDKVVSEGIVTEEDNWSYGFEVPKNDEEGNEIEYHVDEKETPKFYEKELTDKLTVTNKFKVPSEKVKVQAIKLWEDMEDKYSKRPNSVVLQVYNGDKLVVEEKVNGKNNWRYDFELSKYDELGNEIEYRVDEKDVPKYYEKKVSGYTVINKCIYEPVAEEEKIDNEEVIDTSDINIFVYVAVFLVAIIGVIVLIIFVRKKKQS